MVCALCSVGGSPMTEDYSPTTFLDTTNTLTSFHPAGITHPTLDGTEIGEFQALRLLEAGYVIKYDEEAAQAILHNRKWILT